MIQVIMNKRIVSLAQKSKYCVSSPIEGGRIVDEVTLKIEEISGKSLTLASFFIADLDDQSTEKTENEDILTLKGAVEGLFTILKNADFNRLCSLTFREWESFLRDENNQPVFDGSEYWEDKFNKLKRQIIISYIYAIRPEVAKYSGNWIQDDLINKTDFALQCLDEKHKNVRECLEIDYQLVTIEGPDLIIEFSKNMSSENREFYRLFLADYFSECTNVKGINIVDH